MPQDALHPSDDLTVSRKQTNALNRAYRPVALFPSGEDSMKQMHVVEQPGEHLLEKPLSSREVAELLHCNHKTIERHARRGDIPATLGSTVGSFCGLK